MRVVLFKACEYVAPLMNGRQSMIGIFENIVLPQAPVEHPPFFLCLQLELEPGDQDAPLDILAVLIDQDGRTLMDFSAQGEPPRDPFGGVARVFIQFFVPPLRFETPGDYRFDVLAGGRKIGEERLPVLLASPGP